MYQLLFPRSPGKPLAVLTWSAFSHMSWEAGVNFIKKKGSPIPLVHLRACLVMKGRTMVKAMARCSQAMLEGRRGGGALEIEFKGEATLRKDTSWQSLRFSSTDQQGCHFCRYCPFHKDCISVQCTEYICSHVFNS